MRATALFLTLVVSVSALVLVSQVPQQAPTMSVIVWAPRDQAPCQGNFTGEAVIAGRGFQEGCAERWAIVLPPSEHGNLSSQAAYLAENQAVLTGVFLDDFDLENETTQLQILSAIPRSFHGRVCPVLYPFLNQPNLTKGMECILLAMTPRSAAFYATLVGGDVVSTDPRRSDLDIVASASVEKWLTVIRNATASIDAGNVALLVYAKPFSGWPYPIPPNYITAMVQFAEEKRTMLVYFK